MEKPSFGLQESLALASRLYQRIHLARTDVALAMFLAGCALALRWARQEGKGYAEACKVAGVRLTKPLRERPEIGIVKIAARDPVLHQPHWWNSVRYLAAPLNGDPAPEALRDLIRYYQRHGGMRALSKLVATHNRALRDKWDEGDHVHSLAGSTSERCFSVAVAPLVEQMQTTGRRYGAIYVDPPWQFGNKSRLAAERHYETLTVEEIMSLPVSELAAPDCALFMWVTDYILADAIAAVMPSWGFNYNTIPFVWLKVTKHGKPAFGPGWWTRKGAEICLLGTKGKPRRCDASVTQVIHAPVREHSRKPDVVYGCIEKLVSGPYLEIFARTKHQGWHAIGNEVGKFQAIIPAAAD